MAKGPGDSGPVDSQDPCESDCEVALRFSRGEAGALARVVAAHQDRLARLVHRLLGWGGEVEDVVQDVFLAAWTKRRQLRQPGRLAGWLASIAVNRCRNVRRMRFLRTLLLGERDARIAAATTAPADDSVERVRRAVRALPGRLREVAILRYLEEMEVDEICRVLGISPGAARVRLHRAREMLRKSLADLVEEGE
jgi:RNA polymerase sigma factor (sigma-70 family)